MRTYRPTATELHQIEDLAREVLRLTGPSWIGQTQEQKDLCQLFRESWLVPQMREVLAILRGDWATWIRENR